ncbi:MAG: CsgG/HfaB family protein [Arcobacteraceae bacterium]
MRKLLFLFGVLLLFSGCSSKITLDVLRASKVNNPSIKQLAIMNFKNDTIGQASSIESQLSSLILHEKPYFTLVQRSDLNILLEEKKLNDSALVDLDNINDFRGLTQVKTFLMGEVLQSTLHKNVYFKSEKNYQHCLEYNKNKECIRFPVRLIRCQTNDYMVQTQIKAVEVVSSNILYSQTYTQTDSITQCDDVNYLPTKEEHNHYLGQLIAQKILKDLAPHYVQIKVSLLEDVEIPLSKTQEQFFKNALTLLTQNRYEQAKTLLEDLNEQTQEQSYVILYNLALCYETLHSIDLAFKTYEMAEKQTLNKEVVKEISEALTRVKQVLLEKEKINKLIHY